MKNRPTLFLAAMFLFALAAIPSSAQSGGADDGSADDGADRSFGIRITNHGDTSFGYILARYTTRATRPGVPGRGRNWTPQFSGYDMQMVAFTDSTIVPLKAGRTPLVITYNAHIDTIAIMIEKVGGNLVVDFDKGSLLGVRMPSLYQVNTWDTVGGAAREQAMGSITIGMPFEQASALMQASTVQTDSDFPGATLFPIDLQRSIYIEEKQGRVVKVWIGPRRSGFQVLSD